MNCTPCKILGTILKVDENRTSANGRENKKKIITMREAIQLKNDIDRLYESRKEGGR